MDLNPQKIKDIKADKRNNFFRIFNIRQDKGLNKPRLMTEEISDFELMENIRNAKKEWLEANLNFEYVDNKDIIDYYTYKILASQIRYEYFLKLAKEKGFKGEIAVDGQ
jgi:hypothetical protein